MAQIRRITPRRRSSIGIALLVGMTLLLGLRTARAEDAPAEDRPVVDSEAGRQAFEDVRAAYKAEASSVARGQEAAAALASAWPDRRAWGAEYLVALFRQTASDQVHRRTPQGRGMKLGGGEPQDDGEAIRFHATKALSSIALPLEKTEALAPALWLWREDKTGLAKTTALWLLAQIRHPDADAALLEAVRSDDLPEEGLEYALTEVGKRRLPGVDAEVRTLCLHPHEALRDAAAGAAKALELKEVPVWSPTSPIVGTLDRRLREMAARVRPVVPLDASWVRRRSPAVPGGGTEEDIGGWALPGGQDPPRMLDWFGQAVPWRAGISAPGEDTLAEAAKRLVAWREAFDALGRDDFEGRAAIERRIGIGRFGDYSGRKWVGTLPETLVAAWAHVRGDAATTKAVLLPLLESAGDEAAFFRGMRDELAVRLDERMLEAFRGTDYPGALALATHLASPLFDGWSEQQRAKELVAEIPRRGDDFHALALPTPADWEKQTAATTREARVAFLCARLRLLRAWQHGIPGGISYGDDQLDPSADALPWRDPGAQPCRGSTRTSSSCTSICGGRRSARSCPCSRAPITCWPSTSSASADHYPQTFHRVAWVAGSLVDQVAGEDLVKGEAIASGDPARISAEVERLRAWFASRAEESQSDRLFAVATRAPWKEADPALRRLAPLAPERAADAAARRAATDPEHRQALVRFVACLGGKGQVAEARAWAKEEDRTTRFLASWILLRHGNRAAREGLDALLAHLREGDGWKMRDAVLDDLIESGDAVARAYLEAAANPQVPEGAHASLFLLQRRILTGDAAALARVLDAVDGKGPAVSRGDARRRADGHGEHDLLSRLGDEERPRVDPGRLRLVVGRRRRREGAARTRARRGRDVAARAAGAAARRQTDADAANGSPSSLGRLGLGLLRLGAPHLTQIESSVGLESSTLGSGSVRTHTRHAPAGTSPLTAPVPSSEGPTVGISSPRSRSLDRLPVLQRVAHQPGRRLRGDPNGVRTRRPLDPHRPLDRPRLCVLVAIHAIPPVEYPRPWGGSVST